MPRAAPKKSLKTAAKKKRKSPARTIGTGNFKPTISAAEAIDRLVAEAPLPEWRPHQDPIAELALTLLSQNTSDTNSGRAYQNLLRAFQTWDDIVAAPTDAVEDAIRIGGLAKTKAPRLQALLAELRERLGPDWDPAILRTMPMPEAKQWLISLPGVGPKTAACVMLFSLGRPALPVDTHVERVSKRLGLVHTKVNAVKSHDVLEAQMDPELYYDYHVAVIRHGRRVCKAPLPICDRCTLADDCPSAFFRERNRPDGATGKRIVGGKVSEKVGGKAGKAGKNTRPKTNPKR
jgi:endonuclease-3